MWLSKLKQSLNKTIQTVEFYCHIELEEYVAKDEQGNIYAVSAFHYF